jgi:hypothetical protein
MTLNEGMPAIKEIIRVVMRRGSLPRITKASVTLFPHCCDVGGKISDLRLLENAFNRKRFGGESKVGTQGNLVLLHSSQGSIT